MHCRRSFSAFAQAVALLTAIGSAEAFDGTKYPNLKGQWSRAGAPDTPPSFDPSKPPGRGQQAPLTPEYQAILEANLREQEAGVPGTWPGPSCLPPGMPATMTAYEPMEIIVLPRVTIIRIDYIRETRRRIFTDGRTWPSHVDPGFDGYSIGRWIDEDSDGKFDVLEVETRHFKGPRAFDATGMPLHRDNQSIVKERIYTDPSNPNVLLNELTTIDNSLTRPWTVLKRYGRNPNEVLSWHEENCAEGNGHVEIRGQGYFLSAEGHLMPTQKDQPPPDLRYFNQASK